MILLWVF